MTMNKAVLEDRYEIFSDIQTDSSIYTLHKAIDRDGGIYLVKVWTVKDTNIDYFRALWNTELRKMYRISSSPGADIGLLTVRDAGYDKSNNSFVLVMKSTSGGYEKLSDFFSQRITVDWLKRENLIKREVRVLLWRALYNIAEGIRILHLQEIIHRNISADSVFFNHELEPETMRLGGFEWSIRLGEPINTYTDETDRISNSINIEYGFRQDWKDFGQLILKILNLSDSKKEITYLDHAELEIINLLESYDEINAFILIGAMEKAINTLRISNNGTVSYLDLVIRPNNVNFLNKMSDFGFQLDIPDEVFSPLNRNHTTALKRFIQSDLDEGQLLIASSSSVGQYILIGKNLNYFVTSYESPQSEKWDAAYLLNPTELRTSDGNDTIALENARVRVVIPQDMHIQDRKPSSNWKDFIPVSFPSHQIQREHRKLQDFLRAMNQLELFFRMNEIFTVSVMNHTYKDGLERLTLEEIQPLKRRTAGQVKIPNMCQHLYREWTAGRQDYDKVLLSETKSPKVRNYFDKIWVIEMIDPEKNIIVLKRQSNTRTSFQTDMELFIRTVGHYGQMELIKRRKRAIQRLDNHSYLLNALTHTGQVYIDTGIDFQLGEWTKENIDESKEAVIQDVMRTRPIYALQGPPGTGKTTLVAHLVHELFEEDPMVQILVTAQAHGAVDVLRHKISERSTLISVRIGNRNSDNDKDSVEAVAERILDDAANKLAQSPNSSELMKRWNQCIDERKNVNNRFISDFRELIKRSATITYSTASSADLAELADGSDEFDWSFDWSIFEEAGKAHGFDLALPLQTGHRWLLLGDHKQLPPHLFSDFQNMIQNLDDVNEALEEIGKLSEAQDYVDKVWLREWKIWDDTTRNDFKNYSKKRLNLFKFIFESLTFYLFGVEKQTSDKPIGALSGFLNTQYRMHPVIGDLISSVFYEKRLKNGTVDDNGNPNSEFITKLRFPEYEPLDSALKDCSIIWIDMPDAADSQDVADSGDDETIAPFVNHSEVIALRDFIQGLSTEEPSEALTMAILAPYNSQIRMINDQIEKIGIPDFLKPVRNVYARDTNKTKWVHTVDSFQGNEADIVVVTLVRNNILEDPRRAIGFLSDDSRMNVLLSRGRKKLVLIGSLNFFRRQIEYLRHGDDLEPLYFLKLLVDYIREGVEMKKTAIVQYLERWELNK